MSKMKGCENCQSKSGSFGTGFIVGAVVGVVLGLLTAPEEGKETRKKLNQKIAKVKEDETVEEIFRIAKDPVNKITTNFFKGKL